MRSPGIVIQRWRMSRMLRHHPIPHNIWQSVSKRLPVLGGLDAVQMAHLRELTTWFLHNKVINGVQGLEMTPSMRVVVAAQACLLILNLSVDCFDSWVEVIVYPGAFRVQHAQVDEMGLMHEGPSDISGEAWLRGPVILSWDDVEVDSYQTHAGHNIVLHEFAHKLDGLNGAANGMPPLRRGMSQARWGADFNKAYDALCQQVSTGKEPFINPYAATSPAEFFAVATEYFFTAPEVLKECCPGVHKQLTMFYKQDSA